MNLTDSDRAPFITQKMFNDLPAVCIENNNTRIMLNVDDEYEPHFSIMVNGNCVFPVEFIARQLFQSCSNIGLDTFTLDGKTVEMNYKGDFKNLERYIQSKEYTHDIMLGCLYKQLLIEAVKTIIDSCINMLTSYNRSHNKYNMSLREDLFMQKGLGSGFNGLQSEFFDNNLENDMSKDKIQEYYRNIIINSDEFVIFAGKCIRYLENEYLDGPLPIHRHIFGNWGYYDSYSDIYCRLNKG